MAEQQPLRTLEFVVADVVGEGAEVLEHLPRDAFRADVLLTDPRMLVGEGVEGGVNELAVRLGVFQFLQLGHAFVVFDALGLHRRDGAAFHLVELLAEDDGRVFQDGFHQRQQHQRVVFLLGIHQRQRLQQVERQRLVH